MRTIDAHLLLQFVYYTLRAYPRGRILAAAEGKSVQRHMVSENAGTVYILRHLLFCRCEQPSIPEYSFPRVSPLKRNSNEQWYTEDNYPWQW